MPQGAWTEKRERQYDHIKSNLKKRGRPEETAERIAAATVNQTRTAKGETKEPKPTSERVIANLPVLGRLAKDSGKLDVRIFLRDQNDDIMQGYLNKGQFKSIPVFVFLDEDFRELGHWIERPASVTEVRAKRRKEIFAAHPEFGSPDAPVDQLSEGIRVRLQGELAKMRDETTKFANAEVVRELREIATRVAA